MKKIRVYLSMPIRGKSGNTATSQEIEQNTQKGIVASKILSICIPELDIYCPGEHDEFVMTAYLAGRLLEKGVLDTDCEMLAKRDLLVVYDWQNWLSNGMCVEINFAKQHNIKMYFFSEICQRTFDDLKDIVKELNDELQIKGWV